MRPDQESSNVANEHQVFIIMPAQHKRYEVQPSLSGRDKTTAARLVLDVLLSRNSR